MSENNSKMNDWIRSQRGNRMVTSAGSSDISNAEMNKFIRALRMLNRHLKEEARKTEENGDAGSNQK
jgi:uncharacterized protein YukE